MGTTLTPREPGRTRGRAGVAVGLIVFLLVAALVDVPGRLGRLVPDDVPSAAPRTTRQPPPEGSVGNLVAGSGLDKCSPGSPVLTDCGPAPRLGDGEWFNTRGGPLTVAGLRGSVVLVDFFAGSCLACRRDAQYLKAWDDRYRAAGLQIVGVHSPRFKFEKQDGHLAGVVRSLGLRFPVLRDDALSTASDYNNRFRPAKYLIDAKGTIRATAVGEGGYDRVEKQIRTLLTDRAGGAALPPRVGLLGDGRPGPADLTTQLNFGDSRGGGYDAEIDGVVGRPDTFRLAPAPDTGTLSLGGNWTIGAQFATSTADSRSRVGFRGDSVYQLIGGEGTLKVTTPQGRARRIAVSGPPSLRRIYTTGESRRQTLTVDYSAGLDVYTFAFS